MIRRIIRRRNGNITKTKRSDIMKLGNEV
jgi:hypothetical protein